MIRDAGTRFAQNQRPGASQFGAGLGTPAGDMDKFYPLPEGLLNNLSYDLKVAMDKGDGYPLKARFEVKQGFVVDTVGTTRAGFGVAISDSDLFLGTDQVVLVEGHRMEISALTAGSFYELTVPRLATFHGSRRFLFLGMVLTTTAGLGLNLFSAGLVDAHLTLDTQRDTNLIYGSGFSVQ